MPVGQTDAVQEITEGSVRITCNANEVFYNPSQVVNRDLSVLAVRAYNILRKEEKARKQQLYISEKGSFEPNSKFLDNTLTVMEPLGASGLRTLRYLMSLPEVKVAICNDIDPKACIQCMDNRTANGINDGRMLVTCADANLLLHGGLSALGGAKQFDKSIQEELHRYIDEVKGVQLDGGNIKKSVIDGPFDVIDLDPYGTFTPFLDAAMKKVAYGGMLCVTSVDMPVLGGQYPEVAFYRYGGVQLKKSAVPFIHELSLRLVVHAVQMCAAKYGLYAAPLACTSVDFYVRCFFQISKSPSSNKYLSIITASSTHCPECQAMEYQPYGAVSYTGTEKLQNCIGVREASHSCEFLRLPDTEESEGFPTLLAKVLDKVKFKLPVSASTLQRESDNGCRVCKSKEKQYICGPYYAGPLHHPRFLKVISDILEYSNAKDSDKSSDLYVPHISHYDKISGMISVMREELPTIPLYYDQSRICSVYKVPMCPGTAYRTALRNLGYEVSVFHRDPNAVKTNAPIGVVHDIIRAWSKKLRESDGSQRKDCEFLDTDVEYEISFKRTEVDDGPAKKKPRFLPNPEKYWGPMSKPKPG